LCVVATALFLALGAWQVERRAWKLDLIARVNARVTAPAQAVPGRSAWKKLTRDNAEYRHVVVRGTFDHRRETLVQAVTDLGPGFWVMTPLIAPDGLLLINRGFVPAERSAPGTRAAGNTAALQTIRGLLRLSEPGGGFLRDNDPAADRWYSRDVTAIASRRGLKAAAPFFIDADATPKPGGWPRGGLTVIQFRNTHLSYALTWFALAAMAGWATVLVWRAR
jgi:surfeit locus 1 family protein